MMIGERTGVPKSRFLNFRLSNQIVLMEPDGESMLITPQRTSARARTERGVSAEVEQMDPGLRSTRAHEYGGKTAARQLQEKNEAA